jgi:MYXO-CTERM domain-containing protein
VPDGDQDGDGVPDSVEDATGTDKTKADTDGDGLKDGAEDKNGNGKVDAGETDPRRSDTDGGGVGDGLEIANGIDPLNAADDAAVASLLEGGCAVATPGAKDSADGPGLLGLGLLAGLFARLRRRRLAADPASRRFVVPAALRVVSRRAAVSFVGFVSLRPKNAENAASTDPMPPAFRCFDPAGACANVPQRGTKGCRRARGFEHADGIRSFEGAGLSHGRRTGIVSVLRRADDLRGRLVHLPGLQVL